MATLKLQTNEKGEKYSESYILENRIYETQRRIDYLEHDIYDFQRDFDTELKRRKNWLETQKCLLAEDKRILNELMINGTVEVIADF